MSFKPRVSNDYNRAKLMGLMSIGNRTYYDRPFREHIEDIERVLIEFGIEDEKYRIALWVSNSNIPFRKRIEMFGKEIVKISYGFTRSSKWENKSLVESKLEVNKDIITLHLAQRISNINYVIKNVDDKMFNLYVEQYEDYKKSLYIPEVLEHKRIWSNMDYLFTEVGDLNSLFFHI